MSENKAVLFTNWTKERFTGKWNNVEYVFDPGQSVYLEDWKAQHFAKHLVTDELNRMNQPTNSGLRSQLEGKCFTSPSVFSSDASQLESKILDANLKKDEQDLKKFCDSCDSKGVRHKKDCPKAKE